MTGSQTDRLDGLTTSVAVKAPVKAVSVVNHPLTGEQTVDGEVCVTGDRVLLNAQTDGAENGIWVVDTSAWERAGDCNGNRDLRQGTLVVKQGVTPGSLYQLTTANPITIGSTSLSFAVATSPTVTFEALDGAGDVGFSAGQVPEGDQVADINNAATISGLWNFTTAPTIGGAYVYRAGGTDVPVVDGGTGASDAATAATNLGLGTADDVTHRDIISDRNLFLSSATAVFTSLGTAVQFINAGVQIEIGHASDTTLTRLSAGNLAIEGNLIYRAGGTDVPVADGGTGVSTLALGPLIGNNASPIFSLGVMADGEFLVGDGVGAPVYESGNTARTSLGLGTGDAPTFDALTLNGTLSINQTGNSILFDAASNQNVRKNAAGNLNVYGFAGNNINIFGGNETGDPTVQIPGSAGTQHLRVRRGVDFGDGTNILTDTRLSRLSAGELQIGSDQIHHFGNTIAVAQGGTGQTTEQAAINALSASAAATTNWVLTRDAGGNAIWAANAGAGGSGGDNNITLVAGATGLNIATSTKTGLNIHVHGLLGGDGITLTDTGNDLEYSFDAVSLGTAGFEVFKGFNAGVAEFRRVVGNAGIDTSVNTEGINLSFAGNNAGAGDAEIYVGLIGSDADFRTISGVNEVSVAENGNVVEIGNDIRGYAHMHLHNLATISPGPTGDTLVPFSGKTELTGVLDADVVTNERITNNSGRTGMFLVNFDVNLWNENTGSSSAYFTLRKNGVDIKLLWCGSVGTNIYHTAAMSRLVELDDTDYVDVVYRMGGAGEDIKLYGANLVVTCVG